ncbi:MAG TPA: MFS transporter [Candidatus Bathyarchaeia archaeon]|nr:MFS transporter [Candidatus Bathyarchaeia archaeon]
MRKNFQISAFFIYNSCLAIFLTYGLFFNKIATDLGQPPTSIAFVFGAFAIVYGLSSLFMGFLLDRFGPSRTILLGGGLMGAGLLLSSIANSIPSLVLAYGVVGGAGTGSMWPTTSCSVFETFKRDEMRHITGIVSAGTAFGSLFFAPLEAVLIAYFDWRRAFVVLAVIVLTFAVLAALGASGSRRIEVHRLRTVLAKARSKRFASLFSYYALGNAFARTIVMVFVVPMLESQGASIFLGSLALAMIGVGSIAGRYTAGSKRFSEEEMSGLSFIIQGASAVLLLYARDVVAVVLLSLMFGIGYGGYIPQFALLVRKYFGMKEYGAIFGLLLTSYSLGGFVGPIFEGYTLDVFGTFTLGFLIAGLASVIVGLHQIILYHRSTGRKLS